MKLISQIGGYEQNQPKKSPVLKWLHSVSWKHVGWFLFALATALIAIKSVSLEANAIKLLSGTG